MKNFILLSILLLVNLLATEAAHKCVWVRGVLRCNKNPSKHFNVEVRVWDKDGVSIFQAIDPDDLMGVTFTDEDGTFALDGCGDDFDWIPGIDNKPEPYVQILHYCNSDRGETIQLPVFKTFVPQTHDIGILELDEVSSINSKSRIDMPHLNPKFNNTSVKLSGAPKSLETTTHHESAEAFEDSPVIKLHEDQQKPTLPNYHVNQLLGTKEPEKSLELELLD